MKYPMCRSILGGFFVALSLPAFAQVAPYPDTALTGDAKQDVQKLNSAQAQVDAASKEIENLKIKLAGLDSMQAQIEQQHQTLVQRSESIKSDWDNKRGAFNSACTTHPMVVGGAEWNNCQALNAQLAPVHQRYQVELDDLVRQAAVLQSKYNQARSDATITQAQIQKQTNFVSQVRPAILQLQSSIMGQCKRLLDTAGPEQLKENCGNVQFDNANANLPTCDTEACVRARVGSWR